MGNFFSYVDNLIYSSEGVVKMPTDEDKVPGFYEK